MNLPDLTGMSLIEWAVLTAVLLLCAVSVYVVEDEKKKGQKIPGHMCAGCQDNGMVVHTEETDKEEVEQDDGKTIDSHDRI